jgi:DNA invertase Pin-like site-specific DNA recombinase
MAWSVDRLGVSFLQELHSAGVDLFLHQQGIDTSTPAGKAMYQMMGVFAEFERAIIRARINSGIAKARKHGTRSGKPIGRPRIPDRTREEIRQAHAAGGISLRKLAKQFGVSLATVQAALRSD